MGKQRRWILLEHTGSPDDPLGIHFDLLLEHDHACKSLRLTKNPFLDGSVQEVTPLPMHRLEWLDHSAGEVSHGRGWAERVMAGFFVGDLPEEENNSFQIELHSNDRVLKLEIENFLCTILLSQNSSP